MAPPLSPFFFLSFFLSLCLLTIFALLLLVTLPQMIAQTSLDPESVAHIRDYVNELLQWVFRCESGRGLTMGQVHAEWTGRAVREGVWAAWNVLPKSNPWVAGVPFLLLPLVVYTLCIIIDFHRQPCLELLNCVIRWPLVSSWWDPGRCVCPLRSA